MQAYILHNLQWFAMVLLVFYENHANNERPMKTIATHGPFSVARHRSREHTRRQDELCHAELEHLHNKDALHLLVMEYSEFFENSASLIPDLGMHLRGAPDTLRAHVRVPFDLPGEGFREG